MIRIREKIFGVGIALVIISIIIIAVFSFRQTREAGDIQSRIDYAQSILLELTDLYNTTIEHAGAARAYSLNGNETDIQKMQSTASALLLKLESLKNLTAKRPAHQIQLDSIARYVTRRIDFSKKLIDEGKEKGLTAAAALYQTGAGRDYNNMIFSLIQKMQADELNTLQIDEQKNTRTIRNLGRYLIGLLAFILILVVILVRKSRVDMLAKKKTAEQLKLLNNELEGQLTIKSAGIREREQMLREADQNLRQVLSSTAENFYVVDRNYRVTLINKAAQKNLLKAWGKSVSVGDNILDQIPSEPEEPIKRSFEKAFAGEKIEYELPLSISGLPEWVLVTFVPVADDDGTIIGANVVTKDISERKSAEKDKEYMNYLLNERVKELTTLHRVSQILQADEKSTETVLQDIVTVLPAGWQYPDITAARITVEKSEYKTSKFTDGPHKQTASFQISGGASCQIEIIYLEERPEETEGPFLAEERDLINTLAEMLRIYFVRKKAIEQVLNEKNLSDSIINSLPGIFYFYDHTGKFIRWNKRFETETGYSGEEISKMHPLDFFEGEDREHIKNRIGEVFEKGVNETEAFFLTKDRRKIPYYFTGASIEIEGVSYLLGTGIDITERKKAEEELRISREHLKRSYEDIRLLASNIENIREEEKIKIAREIHDELGQQLTGLKMDISWLSKKLNPPDATQQEKIREIMLLLDETVKSVRRIASELRPGLLDDLGLIAAIEWQSQEFEKRSGIEIQFRHSGNDDDIPSRISTGLFRIFQESLTNVARHAQAKEVIATFEHKNDEIILQIKDDGKGFAANEIANKRTLGLLGMKERTMMMGGKYEVVSESGKGTTVAITVSLKKSSQNN